MNKRVWEVWQRLFKLLQPRLYIWIHDYFPLHLIQTLIKRYITLAYTLLPRHLHNKMLFFSIVMNEMAAGQDGTGVLRCFFEPFHSVFFLNLEITLQLRSFLTDINSRWEDTTNFDSHLWRTQGQSVLL